MASWYQAISPIATALTLLLALLQTATPALAVDWIRIGGAGANLAPIRLVAKQFTVRHPDVVFEIMTGLGSRGGVRAVLAGALDLGLISRPLKEDEVRAGARAIPYARTPLVFTVFSSFPRDAVTRGDVLELYSGARTRWEDGRLARPILRFRTDSDITYLTEQMPGFEEALALAYRRRGIAMGTTDQHTADLIQSVPGAIGTSTMALILGEQRPLKALSYDGHAPMRNGTPNPDYPLYKVLAFVVGKDPHPIAMQFIEFVRSRAGTDILQATGHLVIDERRQ